MSTSAQSQTPTEGLQAPEMAEQEQQELVLRKRVQAANDILDIINSDEAIKGINQTVHAKLATIFPIRNDTKLAQDQVRFALLQGVEAAIELVNNGRWMIDNSDNLVSWKAALSGTNPAALIIFAQMRLKSLLGTLRKK